MWEGYQRTGPWAIIRAKKQISRRAIHTESSALAFCLLSVGGRFRPVDVGAFWCHLVHFGAFSSSICSCSSMCVPAYRSCPPFCPTYSLFFPFFHGRFAAFEQLFLCLISALIFVSLSSPRLPAPSHQLICDLQWFPFPLGLDSSDGLLANARKGKIRTGTKARIDYSVGTTACRHVPPRLRKRD